jgi:hypothetical protein
LGRHELGRLRQASEEGLGVSGLFTRISSPTHHSTQLQICYLSIIRPLSIPPFSSNQPPRHSSLFTSSPPKQVLRSVAQPWNHQQTPCAGLAPAAATITPSSSPPLVKKLQSSRNSRSSSTIAQRTHTFACRFPDTALSPQRFFQTKLTAASGGRLRHFTPVSSFFSSAFRNTFYVIPHVPFAFPSTCLAPPQRCNTASSY